MKLKSSSKKNTISGFKPETHWKHILVITFVLLLGAIGYNIYLYVFAQTQIRNAGAGVISATSSNTDTTLSPENIQTYFQVYKDRQEKYAMLLKSLMVVNESIITTILATTSTSTVVATSSNQ